MNLRPRTPSPRARRRLARAFVVALLILAGCTPPPPAETLFTADNAWTDPLPADAEIVGADAFRRGVAAGELALISSAMLAAQAAARESGFDTDVAALEGLRDRSPAVAALLEETAGVRDYDGEREVVLPNDETVSLLGQHRRDRLGRVAWLRPGLEPLACQVRP